MRGYSEGGYQHSGGLWCRCCGSPVRRNLCQQLCNRWIRPPPQVTMVSKRLFSKLFLDSTFVI